MATATDYSSPTAFAGPRSPDTASPIYPERAIRPLPKNRLKSRLSPQQASTLVFPPEPPPISPILNFAGHDTPNGGHAHARATNGDASYLHNSVRQRGDADAHHHHHCTCGEEGDSGDDEVEFDHPDYRYAPPPTANGVTGQEKVDNVQRRLMDAARPTKPPPPASTASSADGYESFENTSNKKKRKIPLSGTSSMHQSQLSAEMANMGISGGSLDGAADDGGGTGAGHQRYSSTQSAGSGGTGISGAGRGRYGRQSGRSDHAIRRPLGSSNMNAVNGYGARLPPRHASSDAGIENTGGIISQAIKSAAEQGPLTPQKGQEKGSLLQSAGGSTTSGGPASTRTQFTFTMESESGNKMVDQHTSTAAAMTSPTPAARNVNGQPVHPGGPAGKSTAAQATSRMPPHAPNSSNTGPLPNKAGPNNTAPPKPRPPPRRRTKSEDFALAAKQRQLSQRYNNYHHRPTKDSMWICEFCEYESIFGVPPLALIREYEIKDQKVRKDAEERRRLLEKARARGRKGRGKNKKGKGGNGNAGTGAQGTGAQGQGGDVYDAGSVPPPPPSNSGRGDGDGDEFYDDDYDNDPYSPLHPSTSNPAFPDDPTNNNSIAHHPRDDGNDEIVYDDAYYRHQQQMVEQRQALTREREEVALREQAKSLGVGVGAAVAGDLGGGGGGG